MEKQADLRKWFRERWVDISRKNPDGSHPECGRDEAKLGKKGYPKCRPKAKAAQMTKKEKSYAVRAKRSKRQGVGGKPTMVPTEKPEKQTKTAMNLFDHFQNGLEKIAVDLDEYRHLPLPKLHNTLKGLRKQHQAASQEGFFSRLKNRSQNKERGRRIDALGYALAQDPLGPEGEMIYVDGDGTEHFGPREEIYKRYQKERPENRALVASNLAEHIGDRYSYMIGERFHGARPLDDEHREAGMRLWAAQHKPGGAQLADAYMKKHFSGGHKKVAARSKPNFQDALKSHATRGFTSMPDDILQGRKRIKAHDVRAAYAEDGDFLMPGEKHLQRYTAADIAEGMAEDAYKRVSMSRDAQKHYQGEADKSKRKANSALNRYLPIVGPRRKAKYLKKAKKQQAQRSAHLKNINTSRELARLHDDAARAMADSGDRKGLRLANDYMKKHFG